MSGVTRELLQNAGSLGPEKTGKIRGHTPAKIRFVQCRELDGRRRVAKALLLILRAEMECTLRGLVDHDQGSYIRSSEH